MHAWGFDKLKLDQQLLSLGKLAISEARGVFQDWSRDVAATAAGARAEIEWLAPETHRSYTRSTKQPPFCAFLTLRTDEARDPPELAAPPKTTVIRLLLSEQLIFDRSRATPGQPTPGVKKTTLWKARRDLSAAGWQAHYRDHAKLVPRVHASAWKYRQNVIERAPEGFPYDAVSELWWERPSDLIERFYASDEAERLVAEDTRKFIDIASAAQVVTLHESLRGDG